MRRRILIVGRGTAGRTLGASFAAAGDEVIGYLDDDATGPDVLGSLADAHRIVTQHDVQHVSFAIPSVDAGTLRAFLDGLASDRVEISIVPRTYRTLAKDSVTIDDLTDIDVLDLVGRRPVKDDLLDTRRFLRGKRVLVTGAAGSIGSTLVRHLLTAEVEAVIGLDWWENGVFFLDRELSADDRASFRIADVKNRRRLDEILAAHRPDVVFHAAAYKHVPLMQENPAEAVANNVAGTISVLEAAADAAVETVVCISTDKAVNPVNVMGATKRIGEIAMAAAARRFPGTRFTAVRFGNVIESNGSVMQIFRDQLARRLPLTVTDAEVTRFFMTLDEAAQLVLQSSFIGRSGDIFVLDMGEPVRIIDLARSLSRLVDPAAEIEIVGLRPGEKMYEELSYEPDLVRATSNPKIFVVTDAVVEDPVTYMERILPLVERSLTAESTDAEVVATLREIGFAIR